MASDTPQPGRQNFHDLSGQHPQHPQHPSQLPSIVGHVAGEIRADTSYVNLERRGVPSWKSNPMGEVYRTRRQQERKHLTRDNGVAMFTLTAATGEEYEIPRDMALFSSSVLRHKIKNSETKTLLEYDAPTVQLIAESIRDPAYHRGLIRQAPGVSVKDSHLRVYFCAHELDIPTTKTVALNSLMDALKSDGLSIDDLKYIIDEYKLFTPKYCTADPTTPDELQELMTVLATYVGIHQSNFNGNDMYAKLHCETSGHLGRYLSKIAPGLEPTQGQKRDLDPSFQSTHGANRGPKRPYTYGTPTQSNPSGMYPTSTSHVAANPGTSVVQVEEMAGHGNDVSTPRSTSRYLGRALIRRGQAPSFAQVPSSFGFSQNNHGTPAAHLDEEDNISDEGDSFNPPLASTPRPSRDQMRTFPWMTANNPDSPEVRTSPNTYDRSFEESFRQDDENIVPSRFPRHHDSSIVQDPSELTVVEERPSAQMDIDTTRVSENTPMPDASPAQGS